MILAYKHHDVYMLSGLLCTNFVLSVLSAGERDLLINVIFLDYNYNIK